MAEHMIVTSEVAAALGKNADELANLTLRQFFELAYGKGYDVRMSPDGGSIKGLTVKMDEERRPILHVGAAPR